MTNIAFEKFEKMVNIHTIIMKETLGNVCTLVQKNPDCAKKFLASSDFSHVDFLIIWIIRAYLGNEAFTSSILTRIIELMPDNANEAALLIKNDKEIQDVLQEIILVYANRLLPERCAHYTTVSKLLVWGSK